MESHGIRLKEEGVTKRKKRAWWKQKSERIAEHRFGGFRISFASPHSSFVLEPDYADIAGGCDGCHNLFLLTININVDKQQNSLDNTFGN